MAGSMMSGLVWWQEWGKWEISNFFKNADIIKQTNKNQQRSHVCTCLWHQWWRRSFCPTCRPSLWVSGWWLCQLHHLRPQRCLLWIWQWSLTHRKTGCRELPVWPVHRERREEARRSERLRCESVFPHIISMFSLLALLSPYQRRLWHWPLIPQTTWWASLAL